MKHANEKESSAGWHVLLGVVEPVITLSVQGLFPWLSQKASIASWSWQPGPGGALMRLVHSTKSRGTGPGATFWWDAEGNGTDGQFLKDKILFYDMWKVVTTRGPLAPSWHFSCAVTDPPRDKTNQGESRLSPFLCPFQTRPRLLFFAQDGMCCLSPCLLFACLLSF